MEAYQERVIEEKKELDSKLFKLESFLSTEESQKLLPEDVLLLVAQGKAMKEYSTILEQRIVRFSLL